MVKANNQLQYVMDLDVLFGTSEKKNNPNAGTGLKILSCGAGMQSTALALMSCENKVRNNSHPQVPIYDLIVFCDMGWEPPWVYEQVNFIKGACEACGIPFKVLETNLYGDYIEKFGKARVPSIPFWSVDENGKKAKMRRHCTIDKKIIAIQKYVRYEILGYKFKERCRKCDKGAHEMHIGISSEEDHRIFESMNPMFETKFPLVEMGLTRADNYKYCLEVWGLETKASACGYCPFHRNYFFMYLKENCPDCYNAVTELDDVIDKMQPYTPIRSKLYISRSRKRIKDLTPEECMDAQTFEYNGQQIWNGF